MLSEAKSDNNLLGRLPGSRNNRIEGMQSTFNSAVNSITGSRLGSVQSKQNADLERWRRKLADAQNESAKRVQKTKSMERIYEEKGQSVVDM